MTRLVADYINACCTFYGGSSANTLGGLTRHNSLKSSRFQGSTTLPPPTPRMERRHLGLSLFLWSQVLNEQSKQINIFLIQGLHQIRHQFQSNAVILPIHFIGTNNHTRRGVHKHASEINSVRKFCRQTVLFVAIRKKMIFIITSYQVSYKSMPSPSLFIESNI